MEFDTPSSTIHQESHLSDHQVSQNNFSLFEKNLHRINESLKYVNQYFTPKYEQPVENVSRVIESNELSESADGKIDQSLKFYNEFYELAMNEIESIRKKEVRNILSEKAYKWECKRKEERDKKPITRNEEKMRSIRERLTIDRDYSKILLDCNNSDLQTKLREEQIKFDQRARSIKFNFTLKIASSLINDLKKTLNESRNIIDPQLHENQVQYFMVLEENLNKLKNLSRDYDENDIITINQLVKNFRIFKEKITKCISNASQLENFSFLIHDDQNNKNIPLNKKSDEAQNEIENFRFTLDDNQEVKSDALTFQFKVDENAGSSKNDNSNFSFTTEYDKLKKLEDNNSHKLGDEYKLILDNYFILKKHLEKTESSYIGFLNDDSCKSLRQELKKAINTPVNSISSVSSWHMRDKYDRLDSLLKCKPVKTGNSIISTDCHKDALAFCKDTLAQKIINIGEQVASVKKETAFEVSSVVTELWQVHPDFGLLLYARFKQKCPWLIPQNPAKTSGQTDEDYYKSLGYNYTNGIVESQDKYVKRMTGIIRLFASIIVTKTRRGKALGIGQAWMLIAATVNLDPQFDITAVLLHEMLIITGYYLKQAYGKQFIKMLRYIDANYMKKIDEVTPVGCGGPVQRLRTFISKAIRDGYVDKPNGIIPYNFW